MRYKVIEVKKGDDTWYEVEYSMNMFWLFHIWQPLDINEFQDTELTKNGYPYKFNSEQDAINYIHSLKEKRRTILTLEF